MAKMRIDTLKSAVEAAGVAMAPASDQFDAEPGDAGEGYAQNYNHARSHPRSLDSTSAKLKSWFHMRWPRALSTG